MAEEKLAVFDRDNFPTLAVRGLILLTIHLAPLAFLQAFIARLCVPEAEEFYLLARPLYP